MKTVRNKADFDKKERGMQLPNVCLTSQMSDMIISHGRRNVNYDIYNTCTISHKGAVMTARK